MDPLVAALRAAGVVDLRPDARLAELTTLRVGGPVRALVTAERDQDLAAVGRACQEQHAPWLLVGRGSNLLVADAGWPGVAIQLGRGYRGIEAADDLVHAGAAEPLPSLAVHLAALGFAGFAWACAVPGSLGGAVRMNAGAHGGELAGHLVSVEVVRLRTGARETWPATALGLRYRHSDLPDDAVVVSATLRLARGDRDQIRAEMAQIRAWRRANQPINEPNCGSVFTNPPGDSAGRLVDLAGGKGLTIGGAAVSELHANFIVTRSGARAADVRALIDELRRRVQEQHGIDLRPEVVMVGDFTSEVPAR